MSKVWFITGAGSGIGAGAAKAALKAGDRVVASGRNVQKVRNALRDVASEELHASFGRLRCAVPLSGRQAREGQG